MQPREVAKIKIELLAAEVNRESPTRSKESPKPQEVGVGS